MDCGALILKYILFLFNMIVLVCGILLIVFGSLILTNLGDIRDFADTFETSSIPISIIVLGCVVFIISFVGCCGAIRENTCLTMTYSIFMLVLFILQVFAVLYIKLQKESFLKALDKVVDEAWHQRHDKGHFMDIFQTSFNCCGRIGAQEYSVETVPNSCCGPSATTCSFELARNKVGCSQAFRTFFTSNIAVVQDTGIVLAGMEESENTSESTSSLDLSNIFKSGSMINISDGSRSPPAVTSSLKRKHPDEQITPFDKAINNLLEINKSRNVFDNFSENIGAQLSEFPEEEAYLLMADIQTMVSKRKIESIKKARNEATVLITSTPKSSCSDELCTEEYLDEYVEVIINE